MNLTFEINLTWKTKTFYKDGAEVKELDQSAISVGPYRCRSVGRSDPVSSVPGPGCRACWFRLKPPRSLQCWNLKGKSNRSIDEREDGLKWGPPGAELLLTVHLHKQLVQRVLLLTLSSEVPSPSLPSHSVNLVNEEDAGSVLPRHDKQISDLHRKWRWDKVWGQSAAAVDGYWSELQYCLCFSKFTYWLWANFQVIFK